MDAGDWVRIQRLKAGSLDSGVSNPSLVVDNKTDMQRAIGGIKTRKESSKWIDYIAASKESYKTESGCGKLVSLHGLCGCGGR